MMMPVQKPSGLLKPAAALATVFAIACGADPPQERTRPSPANTSETEDIDDGRVGTIDRFVPHVSTEYANAGENVELFLREKVRRDVRLDRDTDDARHASLGVVLMIAGATQPAVATYDVRFANYSWMRHLAEAGFDVFAMELTGYGWSPRPRMDDACNVSDAQQRSFLIPNPLAEPCAPSWPFKMAIQSDWDEIDRVVDYLRELRGVDRVSLVGWSRGGPRIGGYAARHPEKVEKLALYSPAMYNRIGRRDPPARLPEAGSLMQVATVAGFFNIWDTQVQCENQFAPAIRDVLRSSLLETDPLGSTWGSEDLWRAPLQNTLWGWNAEFAARVVAPTLIIRGDLDIQAPQPQQLDLYADLGTPQKVFVRVACAGHQLLFEHQHLVLLRASEEWLRDGRFEGHDRGSFFVDAEGRCQDGCRD
jgi:pimeloyl-ACP methyl ester carboxylesterase